MGLLEKLWDDTVAGPRPDSGLGKLRRWSTFSSSPSPPLNDNNTTAVSRSITILRSRSSKDGGDHAAASPRSVLSRTSSPSSPASPAAATPRGWRSRSSTSRMKRVVNDKTPVNQSNPTMSDWVILSSIDT